MNGSHLLSCTIAKLYNETWHPWLCAPNIDDSVLYTPSIQAESLGFHVDHVKLTDDIDVLKIGHQEPIVIG